MYLCSMLFSCSCSCAMTYMCSMLPSCSPRCGMTYLCSMLCSCGNDVLVLYAV